MPDPRLLHPVCLFLMDERSDAAVVGSGNKAMGTSSFLMFRSWCNTWVYNNTKELMTEDDFEKTSLETW